MGQDTFIDAMDGTVTLEAIDNGDGQYAIVNVTSDGHGTVGIALTAGQLHELANTLHTLAAGL